MGVADMVPGVSGGTVAFLTGIYDELVKTLANFSPDLLKTLVKNGPTQMWKQMNGTFMLVLMAGVTTSVFSFAKGVIYLLTHYPLLVWSLFFGLILTASLYMCREIENWSAKIILGLVIGTAIGYGVTILTPSEIPISGRSDYWMLLPIGAIAMCAMILPGLSGSFLLVLMGVYPHLLMALKDYNHTFLLTFTIGGTLGLILFARVLRWMFARYREQTLIFMVGFMIGALNKVWPWRVTTEYWTNRHGVEKPLLQDSVLPSTYFQQTGVDSQILLCLLMMVLGIFIALVPNLLKDYHHQQYRPSDQ